MRTKHIIFTLALAAITLMGGIYIGSSSTSEASSTASLGSWWRHTTGTSTKQEINFDQFLEVWDTIEKRHPDGLVATDEEKMWGAIQGLVDSIGDPYTTFLPPEENENLKIDLKGEFSGVGMEVGIKEGALMVIAPLKDSPSERAGILPGDIIVKIDGTTATGLDVDKAVDLIRGKEGTVVLLTVLRKDEDAAKDISVTREVIEIPVLETEYLTKEKIFIISLFSFGDNSEEEFQKALNEFKKTGSKKLILDLRNNPGGYLSSSINIASWFLPPGKVIVIEKSIDEDFNHEYKSSGHFMDGEYEMVVLVNEGSASASEILAGALQEHDRAKLVGAQTFGKGSVQELIPMQNNTSLKLTIAEWQTPGGISISKEGLTPDVVVEFDPVLFKKDGTDTQLQKAIEQLK